MIQHLPEEITKHLPAGYEPTQGVWLVLPERGGDRSIEAVNVWIRAEDWYPKSLSDVVWFGDDGVGNFLGWKPDKKKAVLWNPEDGEAPWREGTVGELWSFIQNGYQ